MHNLYRIKWKKRRNRSVLVCPYLDRYLNKTAYILRAIAMRVLPETRMDFSVECSWISCILVYWNSEDTRCDLCSLRISGKKYKTKFDVNKLPSPSNTLFFRQDAGIFYWSFSVCYKIRTDKKQRFGDDRKGLICKKFRRTFFLKAWKLLSKEKKESIAQNAEELIKINRSSLHVP